MNESQALNSSLITHHSSFIVLRSPFHVQVAAEVFEDFEAESLVETQGVFVEDEAHVTQALSRSARLFHQSLEERRADAAVLRFGQEGDVQQVNLALVPRHPNPPRRAPVPQNQVVLRA